MWSDTLLAVALAFKCAEYASEIHMERLLLHLRPTDDGDAAKLLAGMAP